MYNVKVVYISTIFGKINIKKNRRNNPGLCTCTRIGISTRKMDEVIIFYFNR